MRKNSIRILSAALVLVILFGITGMGALAATPTSTAGKVTVSYGTLNIRSAPSTASTILSSLPKDSYVTLISQSGGWWKVEYAKGKYGYCSAAYITQQSGTYAAYATSNLNVRSGPSTSYGRIGLLSSGEYIVVLSSHGTWKKVLFNGTRVGYSSGNYLSTSKPQSSTGSGYAAVILNVPSYKQTDSRWANTRIASGGTISTIGCATTALAMNESYRTKTTIYPNQMVSRLNYTPGGAVYWPSNYTTYTGGDYLAKIYSLLKEGKPVIVGAKNANGSQHWVVVTGFTGGPTITAAGYKVNDPGSNTRTNLQHLFNSYPYFYKLMHY